MMKPVIPRRSLLRALMAALLAVAFVWLPSPLRAATQSKAIVHDISALTANNYYLVWHNYNPTTADSVYRFTLTFCPGRIKRAPTLSDPAGYKRRVNIWAGQSLRVTADPTGRANTSRNVTKVVMRFEKGNGCYAAANLTARTGSFTFNEKDSTATWTGRARSIEIFFNKGCRVQKVTTTITYDTDANCVCHPTFTPCDQYDFRTASRQVSMKCATSGATIYYTTNGTTPTTSSTKYTGPVTITKTTLFRAIAVKGSVNSGEDTCKIYKNTSNYTLKDEAFFKTKKYTWVDVNGVRGKKGATITSDMTEEATTTEQIQALLKAVYTDPTIPGQIYQNPGEELTYNRYKSAPLFNANGGLTDAGIAAGFYATSANGFKLWGLSAQSKDPVEGYTVMLVKIRDDLDLNNAYKKGIFKHGDLNGGTKYSADKDTIYKAISECYASVKMLYGSHVQEGNKGYLDAGYNPGALFQFDATLSRFFFISKGDALWDSRYPLTALYEEFAPSTANGANARVYATMMDGKAMMVNHDCPSVAPATGHMLAMDQNGASYQLNNMILFIPDYRLKYWEQNAQNNRWPANEFFGFPRNRDLCGTIGIQAYHAGYEPRLTLYTIKLGATVAPTATEHVYRSTPAWQSTVDDISPSTDIPQEYLLYEVQRDAQGNETLVPLNGGNALNSINEFAYNVPQYEHTYTITYLVKGRLKGSSASWTFSNYAEVEIPGYEETRLGLVDIGTRYTSTYLPAKQLNAYRNYPRLVNDPIKPLLDSQLKVGTKFHIHRYDDAQTEPATDNVVATIEVTTKTAVTGSGYKFTATVTANASTQSEVDATLYPGTFTFTSGASHVVDFGNLYVTDQFSASTAENDHPDAYYYQLTMIDANNAYRESRVVKAPVYKTDYTAMLAPYAQSQVDGDTDHSLNLDQCAAFALQVHNDAPITTYAILRDLTTTVAMAQHSADGKYTTSGTGVGGTMSILARDLAFDGGATEMTVDLTDFAEYTGDGHDYVAVINVNTNDANDRLFVSTYGTPQRTATLGYLEVDVTNQERTAPYWTEGKPYMSYAADVTVRAAALMEGYTPWLYRLWRVNRDGSETLLNGHAEDIGSNDDGGSWATTYGNLDAANPGQSVTVHDIFRDAALSKIDGNEFTVTYIARLYNVAPVVESFGAPRRAEAARSFNVTASSNTATFNQSVVTGVTALSSSPAAVEVTYYNLLGTPGATPHPGVNIVVTRLADGTTVTERLLRP